jgi:hypothetical protein
MAILPQEWLQSATVQRIHLHWTAGQHNPSENDKDHYHILIAGDGRVVKGNCDIAANSTTSPRGKKAHHTLNANTGALAVSMACMMEARERPFDAGPYPLTKAQWEKAAIVTAELCRRYKVPVTARTVLSHAEVQANLSITQRGKWDVAVLPFDRAYDSARACGNLFRKMVQDHLTGESATVSRQMVVVSPTSPLNVRGGPGAAFEILKGGKLALPDGTKVLALKEEGNWTFIRVDKTNDEGWVFNHYLKVGE